MGYLFRNRISIRPLCIQGHVALYRVIFKVPFFSQLDIFIPAHQMLPFPNRVFRPCQLFTVDSSYRINGRTAIGFKLYRAVGGKDDGQCICFTLVAAAAIRQGDQKIRYGIYIPTSCVLNSIHQVSSGLDSSYV